MALIVKNANTLSDSRLKSPESSSSGVRKIEPVKMLQQTKGEFYTTITIKIPPKEQKNPIKSTAKPSSRNSSSAVGEKPFQCEVCEKQFRQLSTLSNHFKIHTGEKPFKCTICEREFRQSSTLTNHMKIHTGEKPFSCSYCGQQFRQLSTLTNHLKIHTGEKPFECVLCKKQFRQSSTLNNHIKIHFGDRQGFPMNGQTIKIEQVEAST